MKASFSNWRTEVPVKSSGLDPIIYLTKITKTKVIPLYRLADHKGESQDIVCYLCSSFDIKTNEYTEKTVYPFLSIVSVKDEIKTPNEQISLDMVHNCNSFGIEVQDGIKEEGWKGFEPSAVNPCIIPIDDLSKYYKKEIAPVLDARPIKSSEVIGDTVTEVAEVIGAVKVTKVEERKEKAFVKVDASINVVENEPPYHFASQPKGQRGRPRKVYDDPEFDALIRSIPHSLPCKGCGKDIMIVPLNFIDKALRVMKVDVKDLLANYKCRSCK